MQPHQQRLSTHFAQANPTHRILLWYGRNQPELIEAFQQLELPDVTKIELTKNAYATKVRVLLDEPDQKFLLFHPGAPPPDTQNWLLDLELSYHVFATDLTTMYRQELGVPPAFDRLIERHSKFFRSGKRRTELASRLLKPELLTPANFELALLGAAVGSKPELYDILLTLLGHVDWVKGPNRKSGAELVGRQSTPLTSSEKTIHDLELQEALWEKVTERFGYQPGPGGPSVADFTDALFLTALAGIASSERPRTNAEALVLLSAWQDSRRGEAAFRAAAETRGAAMKVREKLLGKSPVELVNRTLFKETDQVIIIGVRDAIVTGSLPTAGLKSVIEARRSGYWYDHYANYYGALAAAVDFFALLPKTQHPRPRPKQLIEDYAEDYHQIDAAYRDFYYHHRQSGALLNDLADLLEERYVNGYLTPLNRHWQGRIDEEGLPTLTPDLPRQREFWTTQVQPYLDRNTTLFVIISDGLRYESAAALTERINGEGRYAATLSPMLASVPTYTQLGMASLLPHKKLELLPGNNVEADGVSTAGTANRNKILKAHTNGRAVAMTAETFRENHTQRQGGRDWIKDYDVVYLYLNLIDKAGENEEDQLFARTQDSFDEVVALLSQIVGLNRYNALITADHGYLYQVSKVAEADFASYRPEGDDINKNRRFVVGTNLQPATGARVFSAEQLDLKGNLEVLIPNATLRIRQKGSGSRYVHGGMSLQEMVLPIITVQKKRAVSAAVRPVKVELLGTSTHITANRKTLAFYQTEPTGGKVSPITLTMGFYDTAGNALSDEPTRTFASESAEAREREQKVTFQFKQSAAEVKDRTVYLIVRAESGAIYDQHPFEMYISHGADFADFDLG